MKLFALIAFYLVGICMVTVSPGDYTQSQKRRHEIEDLVLEKLKVKHIFITFGSKIRVLFLKFF